jgi:copper resistance protein D
MMTWFIITRIAHIGACLLLFGIFAFDRFVAAALAQRSREMTDYWQTRLRSIELILLPLIFVSGAAWLALVAMTMSEQSLQMDILKTVWAQTQFGTVWKIRLLFLFIATITAISPSLIKSRGIVKSPLAWLQLATSGCLLGSLAWAGHGQESLRWHLFADVLHLLGAGFWPAGLLPLFLLLKKSRRLTSETDWLSMAVLVNRFSAISLLAVSLLVITGFINSWFLAGSFSNLLSQRYGHWLLAKIIFFGVALTIASVNLLRLKPRLLAGSSPDSSRVTVLQLQRNVQVELLLATAIIIIVAVLGILPPATQ